MYVEAWLGAGLTKMKRKNDGVYSARKIKH